MPGEPVDVEIVSRQDKSHQYIIQSIIVTLHLLSKQSLKTIKIIKYVQLGIGMSRESSSFCK
jgi:hypothetical protein